MTSATMTLNNELNGVELYFDNKPMQTIIDSLKNNGFRWSGFKKCWYSKQSEKTLKLAKELTGEQEEQPESITVVAEKIEKNIVNAKNNISLWKLTRWTEQNNFDKNIEPKEIAAEIRKHVRSRFPFVKFTVTCKHYNSINFDILSSPFEKNGIYLKAIQEYCTNLLKSYKYCTCYDPYGDYGSSYNFYGSTCDISYNYIQTEQTESIKADMIDFDQKSTEFEQAEEERKEKEYQEQEAKHEEEYKEYLIRQEEEKKQIEIINNSVTVTDLESDKQYFVIGSQFANLNKNCTLDEYKEEVNKGDFELQNVKITREVHFKNEEALSFFSNMLLNDFDFLEHTGGSFTDDNRINSMTDYHNMTKEERETVVFNLYGVAIYYNNELQFVVDAQGYSYAGYIGLVEGSTIEKECVTEQTITTEQVTALKTQAEAIEDISTTTITELDIGSTWNTDNWTEYKELMKEQLKDYDIRLSKPIIQQIDGDLDSLKVAMYKLLTEVDGIQEQFKQADLKQGQKITMFYISGFGSMSKQKVTLDKVEYTRYAQYDNAVKIIFTPQGKRSQYYNYQYGTILVYDGWLTLPEEVLNIVEQTGTCTVTRSKYLSCDKQQYDEILEYFASDGIKPIVNTYKPIF